jgi:septum site-determining protein MinC
MNDAVFALKSQMIPLTVIELSADDSKTFAQQLDTKVKASPALFDHMPAILGLEAIEPVTESVIQKLLFNVRKYNILPIALKGSNELKPLAQKLDLAWIPPGRKKLQKQAQETKATIEANELEQSEQKESPAVKAEQAVNDLPESITTDTVNSTPKQLELTEHAITDTTVAEPKETEPESADHSSEKNSAPGHLPTKVISTPVRSGQQIYAKNCDLIVLSQVGQGAEVIADGNIHIYGTLRGRAIAGASGNKDARIFCQSLQAELISIAGIYQVSEDLPSDQIKQPGLVELKENHLHITTL